MEDLERFRQASTTGNAKVPLALSDLTPPESNASKEPETHYFQPNASSTTSTPSLVSSSTRDENHVIPFQAHPGPVPDMSTSSLDTALSLKPPIDHAYPSIWNLGRPVNIGLEVEDISQPRSAEYDHTLAWPYSNLGEEVRVITQPLSDDSQPPMRPAHEVRFTDTPTLPRMTQELGLPAPHSEDSKTALHMAAENGKTSTVHFLLSLQPDIDILAQDADGRTALHLAVFNHHQMVIQELVTDPICLEVRDHGGQTALHAAAAHGNERAVACLLAAGADFECKDSKGRTAFHLAAADGRNNILQLLFKEGADINAKMSL